MQIKTVPILLAISALFVVVFAACSSQVAVSEPIPSEALSVEEIINRSRLAMADVITYKTRGETHESVAYGERRLSSSSFSEFHSYDRYKFGDKFVHDGRNSKDGSPVFDEWLIVGTQMFLRNSDPTWQEREPRSEPNAPTPPSIGAFSFLYEHELSLVSSNEITSDGAGVYRVGYTENYESFAGDINLSVVFTSSLLIDKESFRVVSRIFEKDYSSDPYGPDRISSWQTHAKIDYYDYNHPVVIEVPDEYVPWEQLVFLK